MKKFWKISGIMALFAAVVAFAGVTAVFAQGPTQPAGTASPVGNQGQNTARTGMGMQSVDEAAMHDAIAQALGISIETFEAEVANGENAYTLAQKLGVDFADVQAAMNAVHEASLQQAVEDGLISQEQANWILGRRGGQMGQGNQGASGNQNDGYPGMMGRGAANNNQLGDCQYQAP